MLNLNFERKSFLIGNKSVCTPHKKTDQEPVPPDVYENTYPIIELDVLHILSINNEDGSSDLYLSFTGDWIIQKINHQVYNNEDGDTLETWKYNYDRFGDHFAMELYPAALEAMIGDDPELRKNLMMKIESICSGIYDATNRFFSNLEIGAIQFCSEDAGIWIEQEKKQLGDNDEETCIPSPSAE